MEILHHMVTALNDSDRQYRHFSNASPSFQASACVPLECARVSTLALTKPLFFFFPFPLFLVCMMNILFDPKPWMTYEIL